MPMNTRMLAIIQGHRLTDMNSPYDLSVPKRKHDNAARSLRGTLSPEAGGIRVNPTAPCMKDVSPEKMAASSWPSPLDPSSDGPSACQDMHEFNLLQHCALLSQL